MKRRRFFKTLAAAPAVPALVAQQSAIPSNTPAPSVPAPAAPVKLETAIADDVADMAPKFFSGPQFAALRKLGEILMPAMNGAPGAIEAGAAEFLDFLISQSPQERQDLYRVGLDLLNSQAKKRFKKAFAEVDSSEAATLLASLREAWTFDPPADPLARFLRAAKQDVRTATMNSREYTAAASASGGRRGAGGVGLYWFPID